MLAGGSCAGRHPGGAPTPVTPNQTHGARRWVLVGITSLLYRRLAVFEHGLSIDDALGERLYCVELSDERNIPRSSEPRSGREARGRREHAAQGRPLHAG
jgi:hypothetical protein